MRLLQDELALFAKRAKQSEQVLARYQSLADDANTRLRMRREWDNVTGVKQHGGKRTWLIWVVQMICELLVSGTPPGAVRDNISIMYWTLYGKGPEAMPSVNFIRECRIKVEVIGETITALRLASSKSWDQLWTDATSRRQVPFTALIVGMLDEDNKIDPLVVSSYIFMEDERAETQAAGIIEKVSVVHVSLILCRMMPFPKLFFLAVRLIHLNIGYIVCMKF